ncbi:MAG: DNA repair exonuclease [Desulfobacterales bacterium]|nr:DNA repair exonuclease [Desulfobacterales bacterium]
MIKFIHAADVHIDSPLHRLEDYEGAPVDEFRKAARRAFENMVQLAVSEKVAFMLIAGDLYDGDWKDYNTGLFLARQMSRLDQAGIPVFIIAGNHDAASQITKKLRFPENVRMFPADRSSTFQLEDLQVAVHGQSFSSPAVKKNLAKDYPDPVSGFFNIGLLHTCANGREGHEPYAPCTVEDLSSKGYDYWALGHVHQYEVLSQDPPVVFSGNIQGRHIRETGTKGCVVVDVDDAGRSELTFTPVDVLRWARADVNAAGAEDPYRVVDLIRSELEKLLEKNDGIPLAVRVFVAGETKAHSDLLADPERWTTEIRSVAGEVGVNRIWVEKIRIETEPPLAGRPLHKTGAIGELLELIEQLAEDPSARQELSAELADLDQKLPREIKDGPDGLHFDDPDWTADLLVKVQPMLIRRLLRRAGAE